MTRHVPLAALSLTAAALASPAQAQDAGAAPAAELGCETDTMLGLMGPTAYESTALTTTRTLDAAEAIPALDGYIFRACHIIVGPDGVVPLHSHAERPAIGYVVNGSILEMRSANDGPERRSAGDGTLDPDIAQWWHDDGDEPVPIFVGDLCPEGSDPACALDPVAPGAEPVYEAFDGVEWTDEAGTAEIDGLSGPAEAVGDTVDVLGPIDPAAALAEVDGHRDWDGGCAGNPPLFPFYAISPSSDVLIVQINPTTRAGVPTTAPEIASHRSEIQAQAALLHELRSIDFVARLLDRGALDDSAYRRIHVHMVEPCDRVGSLGGSAASGEASGAKRAFFAVGIAATLAVTILVGRRAKAELAKQDVG